MANHSSKCGLHGLVIAVRVYCILQNLAPPYMCPEPTFVQFIYVLNLMLVNVKWASVAQQLVHDVSKKDVYCLFEALIYKQCMVYIWAPCTVNSGLCLRLCVVFTQIICIAETETVQIYIGAISWCFEPSSLHIQPPVGPYYQTIDTFLRLRNHPMRSGLEHCAFQLSFFFCTPLQVTLRRVWPLSTPLQ